MKKFAHNHGPTFAPFDEFGAAFLDRFEKYEGEIRSALGKHDSALQELRKVVADAGGAGAETRAELDARLSAVEQKSARRGGSMEPARRLSLGQQLVASEEFKALAGSQRQRGHARVETKAITSVVGSAGGLIAPDYRLDSVPLPMTVFKIRDLLAPGVTESNTVVFIRQATRTINAAIVAENTAKPYSDATFTSVTVPVKTIAHMEKASRQILDDAPQLRSIIDNDMRYGLDFVEEQQLLYGDGTGQNMLGLLAQATPYSAAYTITGATAIDVVALACLQAELAKIPASGLVLHPSDWRKIRTLKDAQGRYVVGDPLGLSPTPPRLWGEVDVATSLSMTPGQFLLGSFKYGAQLFDRMMTEVSVSTENVDDFERNMVSIRAERRVALAVKQPLAFISGTFP